MPALLIYYLLAAIACGVSAAWALPPQGFAALVVVSGTLLLLGLWSINGKRPAWKGFAFAFIAGTVANALQLRWLSVVSPLGAAVLPLYLGLFWGLFGAFAATLGNPGRGKRSLGAILRVTFANAAVWGILEWLRGWLFTGFGWNGLGVSFHDVPLVAQAADLLGIAGLSLLVIWISGLIVITLRQRDGKAIGSAAVIVALVLGYGGFRIHQEKGLATTPLKALLVQENIPQDAAHVLWDAMRVHAAYEKDTLAGLEKIKAADQFPDWVIWPESALTGRIMRTDNGGWGTWQENLQTIAAVREAGDFTLIFGANELEAVAEGEALVRKPDGKAFNSLVVMSPEDELQTFRKHHLVIFGETIPFVESIPLLKKIYAQQAGVEYGGSFTPGTSFEPLAAVAKGQSIGIIPSVCFEDTVPRLPRRFLKPGPQVIVNVTNDGWFKETPAAEQHFANARFRAIELRRPMLRCANTGLTAAISTTGSTLHPHNGSSQILTDASGNHFTSGTLLTELAIPLNPPTTLYALIGDLGIILTGIGGFLSVMLFRARTVG